MSKQIRDKRLARPKKENIKVYDFVKCHYKGRGWYGKVYKVEKRPASSSIITASAFCTKDGRPYRKAQRRRLDETWFEKVESLPKRFYDLGGTPMGLPGPPGGTLPVKFTDLYKIGDPVSVIRTRHGWYDGKVGGKIVEIYETGCVVEDPKTKERWNIEKTRDIY